MKHLKDYVYEGLFNVDRNISDTHEIEKSMFEDPESEFWKFCVPYLDNYLGSGSFAIRLSRLAHISKNIDIDREIIDIDSIVELNTRMTNPFSNKYILKCGEFYIGNKQSSGPHPEPIANGGGFKEIDCDMVQIDGMCEKLGGFNFNINPSNKRQSNLVRINWASDLDYLDAKFNFIDPSTAVMSFREVRDFPNLKYVKSNAEAISFYDASFFDCEGIKTDFDKFFGKGTINANGVIKKKNIRNIVAIVNNMRKYGALIPTEVIPEGSLSDLIDISGFKNLKKIMMRNNNVRIIFVKPDNNDAILRQARFVRMNNMNLFKDTPIDELVTMVKQCQTKDGWVVLFEPEQF